MHGKLNGDDFFDAWHDAGDEAFRILQDGFDVPPSFETFRHGLEERRRRIRSLLTVQAYAHFLVASSKPVNGL